MVEHLVDMFVFPPVCSSLRLINRQTDRQTGNTSHKDKQMESDVNTQTAALMLRFWQIAFLLIQNFGFSSCLFSLELHWPGVEFVFFKRSNL